MTRRREQRQGDYRNHVYLSRVERDLTGGITLHLIQDHDNVDVTEGAEYLTVGLTVDPFKDGPTEASTP